LGVFLGDFNRDGQTDVVTSAVGSEDLIVLRGNGDGTLRDALHSHVSAWLMDVSNPVADFNHDGKLDVLMRDGTGNAVVLARGNGDGTFWRGDGAPVGTTMNSAVVGDVNGDGKLDVVAMRSDTQYGSCDDYGCYDPVSTRSAWVLLGYGDGSFAVPAVSELGTLPGESFFSGAVLADFDGDGAPDLAASDSDQGTVAVAHNNGNWTVPPPQPVIRVGGDVAVTEGNTGTRPATFTVTLSVAYPGTVMVNYATYDIGASAGSDYQATSGTLTFAPGETSKTIAVLVNGDRLGEGDETFGIMLSSPTNGTIAADRYYGLCTIVDDEPRISISDVTRYEGKKGQTTLFTFTVTLSAAYDQAVTMSFQTVNGTAKTSDNDYVAQTGTLTFAPGETTKTITIVVNGDSKKEANEYFYLDLFGNSDNSLFAKSRGIGTILNDD
jgi:hypothetical protein